MINMNFETEIKLTSDLAENFNIIFTINKFHILIVYIYSSEFQ